MIIAAKTSLNMGSGNFSASAIAASVFKTSEAFAPKIGSLSYLAHKEAEARVHINTDAVGVVKVLAGVDVLASFEFTGETWAAIPIDLATVQGQTRLMFEVDITTAGTGTGSIQGAIDIDQPAILSGC